MHDRPKVSRLLLRQHHQTSIDHRRHDRFNLVTVRRGVVSGTWIVCKKGQNFGIALASDG